MFSKLKTTLLATALFMCPLSSVAFAQDSFSEAMKAAAAATKEDLISALNQYLELRVANPDNVAVIYSLGRTYQRLRQCDTAQNLYIDAMSELSEKDPIYTRAIDAYAELDGCQQWDQVYFDCEIPLGGYAMIDEDHIKSCWDRAYSLSPGDHTFKIIDADGNVEETTYTAVAHEEGETYEKKHISLKFERYKEVEKIVEVDHNFVMKDRFHPALYWGLIAGGAAFVAGGGFMSALANNAQIKEQEYADAFAIGALSDNKKAQDQHDKVKLYNILSYSLAGLGGAAIITGIALAIVNATSEKERVEESSFNAYISPSPDGISMGMGFKF